MWPTIIIARQIAARRVKAELAAQGIKLHQVRASDIKRWAEASISAELLAEADAIIEASPELKKIAERQRRLKLSANATRVPGKEASPVRSEPSPALPRRHRARQRIEETILQGVQKTPLQSRRKRPARSGCAQHELWPTGIDPYPYTKPKPHPHAEANQ